MNTHNRCTYCHLYFNAKKPTGDQEKDHRKCVLTLLEEGKIESYDKWILECQIYSNNSRPRRVIRVKTSVLNTSTTQGKRSPISG